MGALENELQAGLGRLVTLEDTKGFSRPNDLAGGDAPAEAAGSVQFLRLGQIGLALPQSIFRVLALGDIFACDQHDKLAVSPSERLGAFAHPEHRTILPDLWNLPGVRLADTFKADRKTFSDELTIFFEKDAQHGLAGELRGQIAELCSAKGVHIQNRSALIDHEVHDRVVLEDFPPFPFAIAQIDLTTPELRLGLKRRLLFLAGISDQPRHDQRGEKEGDEHRNMARCVEPELEAWPDKQISQACNRQGRKQR